MKIIITLSTLFILSCASLFVAGCTQKSEIPVKYAKYIIWVGTATFSSGECADEYQISEDGFVIFYQLPSGIKTTIPLLGIKQIEERLCKYEIK
jgi:hypothetical protein